MSRKRIKKVPKRHPPKQAAVVPLGAFPFDAVGVLSPDGEHVELPADVAEALASLPDAREDE